MDESATRGLGYIRKKRDYTPEEVATRDACRQRLRRSTMVDVTGFDTGLPKDDIETALREHFGSCGEITSVDIGLITFIYIEGEDAKAKALGLDGSHVRGRKIRVTCVGTPASEFIGLPPSSERARGRPHYGFSIPDRFKYYN